MLTRDKPLGDIGVAQSLHDELQHIQLASRQHERERLRGHPPRPLTKIDAERTSQNPPTPNRDPNIIRPPPGETKCRNAADQPTTGGHAAGHPAGFASPAFYFKMLTARATTSATVTMEMTDCRAMASLAQRDSGSTSVGLNADALVNAR